MLVRRWREWRGWGWQAAAAAAAAAAAWRGRGSWRGRAMSGRPAGEGEWSKGLLLQAAEYAGEGTFSLKPAPYERLLYRNCNESGPLN